MKLTKPKKLQAGDKVATITLSWGGAGGYPHRYEAGKKQLEEKFGVTVVETSNARRAPDWIAKNPKARADDLMEAFSDKEIKGIISIIGGDDSIRIAKYVDLNVIKNNPKIFLGFSDTTVTHFLCMKAGLSSFYGPSILAGFDESGGLFPYMEDSIRRTLFSTDEIGEIKPNNEGWTVERQDWGNPESQNVRRKLSAPTERKILQGKGVVSGHLIGGCMEVLEMLKGTEFWPEPNVWDGAILFLETSEDAPPKDFVKWWLRNYAAMGVFERINGIIFGRPGGEIPLSEIGRYDEVLLNCVRDECGLTELPIMAQMDFGHTFPHFVLPYGQMAEINCDRGSFRIIGSAVT